MIRVECPGCGQYYDVGDDKSGRKFRCKRCPEVVEVPAEQEEFDWGEEEVDYEPSPRKPASGRSTGAGQKSKRSGRNDRPADDGLMGLNWWLLGWKRINDLSGRSRRKEYWMLVCGNSLIFLGLILFIMILESVLGEDAARGPVGAIALIATPAILAMVVVTFVATVRRLHDIGRSGWWVLLRFVPVAGDLIMLIFMLLDSQPGKNQWGPNPKR